LAADISKQAVSNWFCRPTGADSGAALAIQEYLAKLPEESQSGGK